MAHLRHGFLMVGALGLAAGAAARVSVDENPMVLSANHGDEAGGGAAPIAGDSGFDERHGGFYFASEDGRYRLVLGGRVQARMEAISGDEDEGVEDVFNFAVRRARLYAMGNIYSEQVTFLMQIAADRGEDFELLDGWLKYMHSDALGFKAGQFKVPFSRQQLTSSGRLQFNERSIATEEFAIDRDLGVEASGGFDANRFQWAAAVVNGEGRNTTADDTEVAVLGRVAFNWLGDYGYSEGDLEESEEKALSLGLAMAHRNDENSFGDNEFFFLNLDGGVKCHGASIQGEYYYRHNEFEQLVTPTPEDPNPVALSGELDDHGLYLQGGYFVSPSRLEVVGRWSRVLPDGEDNDRSEVSVGINYFWLGHRLKFQGDYSYLDDETFEQETHRVIAQGQLWF